ncbi:SN-glycerol-3-phosphate ABC transporter, ATP-binding protein [Candidatus Vecturithrix granuli]|uniref:SN-glycerol-3-phosphate ABC transporter, ATP-binding protein n=1 Tax=Vecturithrix granuli TaxID=1499967 RepID=A0A0S6WAI7_VECG1|nr:SN-glycerol-3-phosphate ABC transporter, ATP-binding protein [Candidatus Vecturithrix granuli]
MAEVTLKNIYKSYGKTEVIHGVSCEIADGEFVVLLGPSGCGKSTILRMIAGLEKITAGEIEIGGKVVNDLEPMDRDIAMVFQNYALYPHMSVYKNMAYGLKIRRMPKDEIEKRVQEAANMLGLSGLLARKPRELSGGQRQRVAMGRCIVREPQVFLFDEPLSNLDAKLRVQMRLELRNLHEKMGITSIYVTHDQVEAMTLGDKLVILNNGYAEQIGSPLEVYERPSTLFVAGFIGSPAMNFFRAQVSSGGKHVELPGGDSLPLLDPGISEYSGQEIVLGIRPEHFRVNEDGAGTLHLRVSHVETLGADTLVYGYLGKTETFVTVRLADIHHFKKDAVLSLLVAAKKLHLFDKQSERRIGNTKDDDVL